jgi:hypothetical protein
MSLYALALFVHLVGVIGIFAGLATWLFGAVVLVRADRVEQVRVIAGAMGAVGNLVVASILVLAAGGFYMGLTTWGIQAVWLDVATVAFALLAPIGAFVIDPRVKAILKLARQEPDGPLPQKLAASTRSGFLLISLLVYVVYLQGIVFLMATKPALIEAMIAMVAAVAGGVILGLIVQRTARARPGRR